jgi:hypothetical protein
VTQRRAADPSRGARIEAIAGKLRWWRWRLLSRPSDATVKRVVAGKVARLRAEHQFVECPRVTVIVQSFNQVKNIPALEAGLRRTVMDELIVCEDGSLDGSCEAWLARLTGPNDFLLHLNDVHEIRSYDRAVGAARGAIVCLMQDDDRPPADGAWLAEALGLFQRYPRLAVLGGWCGFDELFSIEWNAPWLAAGDGRIDLIDPASGRPMRFVESVNIGPYLVRRDAYGQLGGFDTAFSAPGEPGITFEADLCYRAWLAGWQVAVTDFPVKQQHGTKEDTPPGGTGLWGRDARERNLRANRQRLDGRYGSQLPEIASAVRAANELLTVPSKSD